MPVRLLTPLKACVAIRSGSLYVDVRGTSQAAQAAVREALEEAATAFVDGYVIGPYVLSILHSPKCYGRVALPAPDASRLSVMWHVAVRVLREAGLEIVGVGDGMVPSTERDVVTATLRRG